MELNNIYLDENILYNIIQNLNLNDKMMFCKCNKKIYDIFYKDIKYGIYDSLNDRNIDYFEQAKISLQDPLGQNISKDINWIKLNEKWNSSKFPVVIGGKGQPVLFLHGFDSSFLEFRRIYPFLKSHFTIIIPDLLGFGFTPRFATNQFSPRQIISNLKDILKNLNLRRKLLVVGASMEGSVALYLAKKAPELVDKIILF